MQYCVASDSHIMTETIRNAHWDDENVFTFLYQDQCDSSDKLSEELGGEDELDCVSKEGNIASVTATGFPNL